MRTHQQWSLLVTAFALAACQKHPSPSTYPPEPGQQGFISQPPSGSGRGLTLGATGATPQSNNAGGNTGSVSSSRTIQEADLYKVVGNTLYWVNTYRGLQIIDVTNPAAPNLLSHVPIIGTPIDLYVDNNTAYVIVSDYFFYWWGLLPGDALGAANWQDTSQVWAVDVSQPALPQVLSRVPIDGNIDQTRIIGNILYVQSEQWNWWYPGVNGDNANLTFVASFDVSNPLQISKVDRVDFPTEGWETHANFTSSRVTLSQSGWQTNGPITNFQVIDISNPNGKLALGTTFSLPGEVSQRWEMDFNDTTGLFRVVSATNWGNSGGALDLFNIPTPNAATPVGHLDLNIQETVTAANFDTTRAYVSTSACVDPLWIIDTTNPAQPQLSGSVSLSGELDYIDPEGNTLVAFGHNATDCPTTSGYGLNVSTFDVTNPASPALVSRVDFGGNYTYVDSNPDDYRKVFQVLDSLNLILVPFSSWDPTNWTYTGGTQFVDFLPTGLVLRGFAPHEGTITRAFPVQNNIFAMSDQSLQVLDASNRDNPVQVAKLDLARPVDRLALFNGYAVEVAGDWYMGDTEIAVTPPDQPDTTTPVATLHVPAPYSQTFVDGNILWITAYSYNYTSGTNSAWLQAIDLTNPTQPKLRGQLSLNPQDISYWGWYWGYGNQTALIGHALAIHPYYWGCYGQGCSPQPPDVVKIIDLSNPDVPKLASTVTLPNSEWSWGLTAVGNDAWITHFEWVPNSNYQNVQFFLDRIDLTNPYSPNLLAKVNVPGVFFSASQDGNTVYVQEVDWNQSSNTETTVLHELTLNGSVATLVANASLNGYPGGEGVNNGFAYVQTWNWSANTSQAVLTTIDLSNLAVTNSQGLSSQSGWLMAATGGKLFLSAGWFDYGIIIYDLSTPNTPAFQGFFRTDGFVEDVVVAGNTAYLPSGYYGVPMIDLTPGSPLPF
jgi:hypothetical protein